MAQRQLWSPHGSFSRQSARGPDSRLTHSLLRSSKKFGLLDVDSCWSRCHVTTGNSIGRQPKPADSRALGFSAQTLRRSDEAVVKKVDVLHLGVDPVRHDGCLSLQVVQNTSHLVEPTRQFGPSRR
jgi:hypothetical protein